MLNKDDLIKNQTVEVLISAMNQNDLSLVDKSKVQTSALIINQCQRDGYVEIRKHYGLVRCISTTERGLSRSRNLALNNAKGKYCIICDDDEILVEGYQDIIVKAFSEHPEADIICFKIRYGNKQFSEKPYRVNYLNSLKISSPQIVFIPETMREKHIYFDERFGSGTRFGSGEENIFLFDCLKKKLNIIYEPLLIAEIESGESQWFKGYGENYFYNRGVIIKRLMGPAFGLGYCLYFVITKHSIYKKDCGTKEALRNILKGFFAKI